MVKDFMDMSTLLTEVENTWGKGADRCIDMIGVDKCIGLCWSVSHCNFHFIVYLAQKLLELLEPPNRLLQSENMDLYTMATLPKSQNASRTCLLCGQGCSHLSKQEKTHNKMFC